jgi:hypothetical protein
MRCIGCGSAAVSERSERIAHGYRRFRCRACGKQFNERSAGSLNRTQDPSDVIALVVLWRLRYKLALRDLPEMFLIRGIVFSHEAVRDWETKLTREHTILWGSLRCQCNYFIAVCGAEAGIATTEGVLERMISLTALSTNAVEIGSPFRRRAA